MKSNNGWLNKTNTLENRWINYDGECRLNNVTAQSQFITYNTDNAYLVSHDTYVSYFHGEDILRTELYEDTPVAIDKVEEADGIILSFNKENESGMQLTKTSEP